MDARTLGLIVFGLSVLVAVWKWDVLYGVYLEFRRAHREAAVRAELDAVARQSVLSARGDGERVQTRRRLVALSSVSREKRRLVDFDDAA